MKVLIFYFINVIFNYLKWKKIERFFIGLGGRNFLVVDGSVV